MKFLPVVAEEILTQNISTECHENKLTCLNWCCLL